MVPGITNVTVCCIAQCSHLQS